MSNNRFQIDPVLPHAPPASAPRLIGAWEARPRVLVVDPAAAIGLVLRAWLGAHGFHVIVEESLEGTLAACRRDPPHLLIAYRSMRGGSALQLSQALRHDPQLHKIGMIYVTALDDHGDIQAALAAGIDDYHRIPFDIDRLYEQIRTLLAHTLGWQLPPSADDYRPLEHQ